MTPKANRKSDVLERIRSHDAAKMISTPPPTPDRQLRTHRRPGELIGAPRPALDPDSRSGPRDAAGQIVHARASEAGGGSANADRGPRRRARRSGPAARARRERMHDDSSVVILAAARQPVQQNANEVSPAGHEIRRKPRGKSPVPPNDLSKGPVVERQLPDRDDIARIARSRPAVPPSDMHRRSRPARLDGSSRSAGSTSERPRSPSPEFLATPPSEAGSTASRSPPRVLQLAQGENRRRHRPQRPRASRSFAAGSDAHQLRFTERPQVRAPEA